MAYNAESNRTWREKNKKHIAEYRCEYNKKNKDRIAEQRRGYCEQNKEQLSEYGREYREKNKESVTAAQRKWRENNKEHVAECSREYYRQNGGPITESRREYNKQYGQKNKEIIVGRVRQWCKDNHQQRLDNQRRHRVNIKHEVFSHYCEGDPCCQHCGYPIMAALSIDHINENGAEHRRETGLGGTAMYCWLRKNSYPGDFQVLCFNCQLKKTHEAKPHPQTTRNIYCRKIKIEVFAYYCCGEPHCQRCGESDIRVLSIDHINGDGAQHRREVGVGMTMYQWIKRNNYPDDLQCLCMNCQWEKRVSNKEL